MCSPTEPESSPFVSPRGPGAAVWALVLLVISSACSVDVGEETKRFACEDDRDCVEGFVCAPVDNAVRKECVVEGSATTADAANSDTTTTDATITDADEPDTTTADADESDTTLTDADDVDEDVSCSKTAEIETSCRDGSGDEDCDGLVDCNDSDCYWDKWCAYTMTVSPASTLGSGLTSATADAICQNLNPQLSDHPTGWKAIISTPTVDARDRVAISGRVINHEGTHLATNASLLWDGTLQAPVAFNSMAEPADSLVWTFSSKDGTFSSGCGDTAGTAGSSQAESDSWLNHTTASCAESYPVYCINRQF